MKRTFIPWELVIVPISVLLLGAGVVPGNTASDSTLTTVEVIRAGGKRELVPASPGRKDPPTVAIEVIRDGGRRELVPTSPRHVDPPAGTVEVIRDGGRREYVAVQPGAVKTHMLLVQLKELDVWPAALAGAVRSIELLSRDRKLYRIELESNEAPADLVQSIRRLSGVKAAAHKENPDEVMALGLPNLVELSNGLPESLELAVGQEVSWTIPGLVTVKATTLDGSPGNVVRECDPNAQKIQLLGTYVYIGTFVAERVGKAQFEITLHSEAGASRNRTYVVPVTVK